MSDNSINDTHELCPDKPICQRCGEFFFYEGIFSTPPPICQVCADEIAASVDWNDPNITWEVIHPDLPF